MRVNCPSQPITLYTSSEILNRISRLVVDHSSDRKTIIGQRRKLQSIWVKILSISGCLVVGCIREDVVA